MNQFGRGRRGLRQFTLLMATAACGAQLSTIGRVRAGTSGAFTFDWSAPPECPSQEQVEADIARLVGGEPRPHDGSDLQAEVAVSRGQLWSAELTTQHAGEIGHRSIQAPSCEAAAAGIALIIALSIDPDAVATRASGGPGVGSGRSPGARGHGAEAEDPRQRRCPGPGRHPAWARCRGRPRHRIGRGAVARRPALGLRAAAGSGRHSAFGRLRSIQRRQRDR